MRSSTLRAMIYGDNDPKGLRRRLLIGALTLASVSALTACTTAEQKNSAATAPGTPAANHFGLTGYGKLTITMTEAEALATGDLQKAPVSTVLDRNVYSFVDGPKPDASRMAADEKLEKQVEEASKDTESSNSAAGHAQNAEIYATSAGRMVERLEAFMTAGGASFTDGKIDTIAAPKDAVTEAGIKRGSTLAELKAAYEAKGLKSTVEAVYALPVAESPGWVLQFETDKDTVKFMALNKQG